MTIVKTRWTKKKFGKRLHMTYKRKYLRSFSLTCQITKVMEGFTMTRILQSVILYMRLNVI